MKTCGRPYHDTLGIVVDCSEETPCRDCLLIEVGRLGYMVQSLQWEQATHSAPVAVEVPRDCETCARGRGDAGNGETCMYCRADNYCNWTPLKSLEDVQPIDPSRILKDGEREELEILRKVAKIIDDKRNAQWEKRGAGPCQRMPDEIDNLLRDWYEIQANMEYDAIRSQRSAEGGTNHHAPN